MWNKGCYSFSFLFIYYFLTKKKWKAFFIIESTLIKSLFCETQIKFRLRVTKKNSNRLKKRHLFSSYKLKTTNGFIKRKLCKLDFKWLFLEGWLYIALSLNLVIYIYNTLSYILLVRFRLNKKTTLSIRDKISFTIKYYSQHNYFHQEIDTFALWIFLNPIFFIFFVQTIR